MIDIIELKGTEEINTQISTQQPTGGVKDNLKIKQVQFQPEKAFNLKVRLTRTIKITSTDTAKEKSRQYYISWEEFNQIWGSEEFHPKE